MNAFTLRPIGLIRSEHRRAEETPIQPVYAQDCAGRVEVLPEYAEGLRDIEGFSHIILLYWMQAAGPGPLRVKPFLEDREHGVFATRSPARPNPIGLSVVRLIRRDGPVLHLQGVDILDGTPILDIKPYSSLFDCFPDARNGWQEGIERDAARRIGRRGFRGNGAPGARQ